MARKIQQIVILAACVYFVQGALGISGIALPLYLRKLGWSVTKITAVTSAAALPWVFKIIYGFVSDSFPLWGHRRKSYLILYSFFSMLGWLFLVVLPGETRFILFALLTANLGFAATDVVTDGLIVEYSKGTASSLLQSIAWGARSFGALIAGVLGGWLASRWEPGPVFLLTAVLPVPVMILAFWIDEPGHRLPQEIFVGEALKRCWKLVREGPMPSFIAILLVLSTSASFGVPFFFFMKESLGFRETFLGTLSSIGWTGAMAGSLIYFRWLRHWPMQKILRAAIVVNSVNILSSAFILEPWSAGVLVLIGGIMGCISLLSIMTSSAVLTHGSGVEGTLFAILMGIFNFGQIAFGFMGGKVYIYTGLHFLIVITSLLALSGLIFVPKVRLHAAE